MQPRFLSSRPADHLMKTLASGVVRGARCLCLSQGLIVVSTPVCVPHCSPCAWMVLPALITCLAEI